MPALAVGLWSKLVCVEPQSMTLLPCAHCVGWPLHLQRLDFQSTLKVWQLTAPIQSWSLSLQTTLQVCLLTVTLHPWSLRLQTTLQVIFHPWSLNQQTKLIHVPDASGVALAVVSPNLGKFAWNAGRRRRVSLAICAMVDLMHLQAIPFVQPAFKTIWMARSSWTGRIIPIKW